MAPPVRPGRPSKLTDSTRKLMLEALGVGATRKHAAAYAGIGQSTFFRWMERGAEQSTGEYREFREMVEGAEAKVAMVNLTVLQIAATNKNSSDWRAAAHVLERRFPHDYGRVRVEVTGRDGGPIEETIAQTVTGQVDVQVAGQVGVDVDVAGEIAHRLELEPIDLTRLTDDEFDRLEQLVLRARARPDGDAPDPG